MAVITTSITPSLKVFPYSGVPELLLDRSDFPRSEIEFKVLNGAIALTGVGDSMFVALACVLPLNYAYTLSDFFLTIHSAAGATNNFNTALTLFINDDVLGLVRTYEIFLPNESTSAMFGATMIDTKTYCITCFPTQLLKGETGGQIELSIQGTNETTNDTAYTLDFFARFQQFDVNQAQNADVNRQTPVRTR